MKCQCEHIAHFEIAEKTPNGNPGHIYGTDFLKGLVRVITKYSSFYVCLDCADDCLQEERVK